MDDRSGLPLVGQDDVSDSGGGVFTVRFRLPSGKLGAFGRVARLVCGDVGSEMHIFSKEAVEYGIPFHECVWVVAPKESPEGNSL